MVPRLPRLEERVGEPVRAAQVHDTHRWTVSASAMAVLVELLLGSTTTTRAVAGATTWLSTPSLCW
jgi:uncharacterized MAPEG superfamily protein